MPYEPFELSPGAGLDALHNRYLRLLVGRGLATYIGSIHVKALLGEFTRHYSPNLLKLLHCEFTGSDHTKANWLLRLVRPPKHAQHPLYHLLLMQFLGCSTEEFFRVPGELSLFGEGPWPCLNPAADHYREPVIQECRPSARLRNDCPIGTFSCECGFSYARSGPDSSPEDRLRAGRVISFGPVWEAKLKGLWKDSSLSMSEVGRRLGVDPLTMRRHAARLKQPSSKRGTPLKLAARLKRDDISRARQNKLRACRSKWLAAMRQNPKLTLRALWHKLPREYAWLRLNDSEWLKGHEPRSQRRSQPTTSVDWKRRDAEYAVAVKVAASRLKDAPGRPVQVTKTAIGRAVGAITLLQQKLHKLPMTAQVLAGVAEAREQYAVRRIRWATNLYCQEYVLPREWQLIMRANVYSLRENPAVKCAVDDVISVLRSKLSHNNEGRAAS